MLARSTKTLIALFAVLGLVLTFDVATYAATGDSLVLGKVNKSKKTTVIKSTGKGPALSLKSKPGAAPLAVSNGNKVLNLNADSVDGIDGAALSNDTRRYTFPAGGPHFNTAKFTIPQVAPGTYLVTLRASLDALGAGNDAQCLLSVGDQQYAGDMARYNGGFFVILSGADVVTITTPTDVVAQCAGAAGAFSFTAPLRVSLTRTNLVADGSLTKSP